MKQYNVSLSALKKNRGNIKLPLKTYMPDLYEEAFQLIANVIIRIKGGERK